MTDSDRVESRVAPRWPLPVLLTTGLILALYVLATATILPSQANVGLKIEPATPAGTARVVAVTPGSTAENAGIRIGDTLDARGFEWAARWLLLDAYAGSSSYAGTAVPIAVERDGRSQTISLPIPVASVRAGLSTFLVVFGDFWMLGFAFVIWRRRPDDPDVRAICYILVVYAVGSGLLNFSTTNAVLNLVSALPAGPLLALSATLFSALALKYVPDSRTKAGVCGLVWGAFAASVLVSLAGTAGVLTGWPDPLHLASWWPAALFSNSLHYLVPRSLALLCGAWAIASSQGSQRQRIGWATGAVTFLYGTTVATQLPVLFGAAASNPNDVFIAVGVFLVPVGLTYAVLNRRMLDIGFIFNRAAVFSAVSIVLVGTFVLVEWLLSDWLHHASHTTSVVVSAGLALILGLSVHVVHVRVDRVVDRVFFRKRHDDEQAIRAFAQDAGYVTDAGILVERTISTLDAHTDAAFANVLLDDGSGRYGDIGENDAGIVRLRATRQILDLHGVGTALRGDLAFPMVARGRLVGLIVLGPRRSGEAYAPDETSAIAQLAHNVGAALDVLSTTRPDGVADLRQSIDAMRAQLEALTGSIPQTQTESGRAAAG